jgi:hypothetical protein
MTVDDLVRWLETRLHNFQVDLLNQVNKANENIASKIVAHYRMEETCKRCERKRCKLLETRERG